MLPISYHLGLAHVQIYSSYFLLAYKTKFSYFPSAKHILGKLIYIMEKRKHCTQESRLKYTGGLKHHTGKEIIVAHRHQQQENSKAVKKQVNFSVMMLQAQN